ncbi:MAG: hypothetical protein AB7N80_14605 [Bdellovibrionales bacterium]
MDVGFNIQIRKALLLFALALGPVAAWALPTPEPESSYLTRFFSEVSYFNTTANYDIGGGSYTSLGSGRYYRLIEGHVGLEHWVLDNVSVMAQMGYARAASYDGLFERTNSSPTELIAGARYVVPYSRFNFVPELWLAYPFNEFSDDTDEALTGEGVMKIFIGLWSELVFGTIKPFAEVGFLYQDDGRASHTLYEAGAKWTPGRWSASGKIYGTHVVLEDEHTDLRVTRDTVTTRVDGGSWKYYSVDPRTLGLKAEGGFDITESFHLKIGYDQTINGEASAAGWTASVGLEYRMSENADRPKRHEPLITPEVLEPDSSEEKRFEPDPPQYDESLFDKPKVKKKPKKRTRPAKKIDVDKALEDVQKSLEN